MNIEEYTISGLIKKQGFVYEEQAEKLLEATVNKDEKILEDLKPIPPNIRSM